MRHEFTRAQKREMFARCKDFAGVPRCESVSEKLVPNDGSPVGKMPVHMALVRCDAMLTRGRYTFDHINPTYITRRAVTIDDGQVICRECDKAKYSETDRPKIDRTRRLADKEIGARRARRSLIPGSKGSGVRRRFNRARQQWETIRVIE